MSRFFVEPAAVEGANIFIENQGDIKHLTRVLRSRVGDMVSISDGQQWEYEARIVEIASDKVILKIEDKQKFAREPKTQITLFQGIPKGQKMETVIQKCVELGVNHIVPVFMERTIIQESESLRKKLQRWQKISDEAVKQCKRGMIPQIGDSIKFDGIISQLSDYDLVICPYENENDISIKDCLRSYLKDKDDQESVAPDRVAVIIGPEGGFSEKEIDLLSAEDAPKVWKVTLGKTILRTETAGPAAISMIMYELEL